MRKFTKVIAALIFVIGIFALTGHAQTRNDEQNEESVKIKFKPRAGYTDEARTANVGGTVYLRVEFLANGKIGEIEEISDKNDPDLRKYGLVKMAIKAAKKIKFSPAKENGSAVTVIKSIVYSFSIY